MSARLGSPTTTRALGRRWCCCTAARSRRSCGATSSQHSPPLGTASWRPTSSASATPRHPQVRTGRYPPKPPRSSAGSTHSTLPGCRWWVTTTAARSPSSWRPGIPNGSTGWSCATSRPTTTGPHPTNGRSSPPPSCPAWARSCSGRGPARPCCAGRCGPGTPSPAGRCSPASSPGAMCGPTCPIPTSGPRPVGSWPARSTRPTTTPPSMPSRAAPLRATHTVAVGR